MSAISALTPADVTSALRPHRTASRRIGFVPTMGALHDGHRALFDRARTECDVVVASIFVNPMQFENPDDLARYPATLSADLEICASAGVDLVYRPAASTMYPVGFDSRVDVGRIGRVLEGRSRAGHYDGVATVVAKLLNVVRPDRAYFGQKDYQQILVVARMVLDLEIGVDIITVPTVRETDGLALSSRNTRLDANARARAVAISRAIAVSATRFAHGTTGARELSNEAIETIEAAGLDVDYVTITDPATLEPRETVRAGDVILVAATIDGVRLIDNAILGA